jgi:hypothetical protein
MRSLSKEEQILIARFAEKLDDAEREQLRVGIYSMGLK